MAEVTEKETRKHAIRKARVKHVTQLIEAEAKKSKPNFGKVAVDARTMGVPNKDLWISFDAAAYVNDVYDADLNRSIHEALKEAGFERS